MSELSLTDRVLARDQRAVARAISIIENEGPDAATLVARLHPHTGRALLLGITGPPGAGKSTLVDRLIAAYREQGRTVGVLAVDPTSPYSGGAILGDRVRMQAHAEDPGVFIRSMATRGHLGGLARTTAEAAQVLDAAGFDLVVIETVGVGQDEVDIVRTADVSVVTVVPGTGDDVQAIKAGIMEIADIFVINKADREGADRTAGSIEAALSLGTFAPGAWRPPVLLATATTGAGIPEIVAAVERCRVATEASSASRRRTRAEWRLREQLARAFRQRLDAHVLAEGEFDRLLDAIAERRTDPYTVAETLVTRLGGDPILDHVGVATADAQPLADLFAVLFDLKTDQPEDVGRHRVRFVDTGPTTVELVEALEPDAPVAKYLASHGQGLHHLCLRVPDLDKAMAALRARGVRLIDEQPRPGAHGSRIAFLHPGSTAGLLIEIKELPTTKAAKDTK